MLPSSTKTSLDTLKLCGKCLGTNLLSRYDNEEGWRRGYNDFSLRMSSSLSKRWVCVVENLSRIFLSKWPPLHLWIMKVYIVRVKGRKDTHKNPSGRMFRDYLAGRPYMRNTRENDSLAQLFSF